MRIDHHDVPVAGLRLLDNGEAGAGALEFLDVDLDAVGLLEGLEQRRVGMVAPDQRVEIGGAGEAPVASSSAAQHMRREVPRSDGSGFFDESDVRNMVIECSPVPFWLLAKKMNQF